MNDLIALDLPPGPEFVDALRRIWDQGDVFLPVDQRLPAAARLSLLVQVRPAAVLDPSGRTRWPEPGPPMETGDAVVVPTSGTTGRPKLVVHTHDGLLAHARAVHRRLDADPAVDRWLSCLPLAHVGGLGVVIRSVLTGTGLDVWDGFDGPSVEQAPDSVGTTLVSLVATALDRIDARRFRWVVLGGSGDTVTRADNVVHTYGLTETGGGVLYGGEPLSGTEVRLDAEDFISLRGPSMARGLRSLDGTVDPVVDSDGWLVTGDIGTWSPDGRLVVSGRGDDLIISGGENIWPEPVERVLAQHPAVRDVAVVGRPDAEWGQSVTAVVVPVDAAAPPTLDRLRALVREELPAYCAPRQIEVVATIPRTALGKPQRAGLRTPGPPPPVGQVEA